MKFNQQYFDSMFKEYNTIDGNKWGINWRASQIKRIEIALEMISNILRKKDISILEIGCATADVTERVLDLNPYIKRYDALDISENAIKICKRKKFKNVTFYCGSILDQEVGSGIYDLILCMDLIYYLSKDGQRQCMEKCYRALKPGGKVLISCPYDKLEIYKLLNMKEKYRIKSIEFNRNHLWACIESKLMKYYVQSTPKEVKRMIHVLLSNTTLMNVAYQISCKLKIEKYTHFYILYGKEYEETFFDNNN